MLCLKSGCSPKGAKAVSSDTGSLAGSDSGYNALLIQSGVQRVETISEMFDYAALYTTQPPASRQPRGHHHQRRRAASWPPAAVRHGLRWPSSASHQGQAQAIAAAGGLVRNPVD